MALNYENIQIDEELEKLLPPLSKEDYNILEQSLLKNGFKEHFGRIKIWFPDGGDRDEKVLDTLLMDTTVIEYAKSIISNFLTGVMNLCILIQKS